MTPEVVLAFAGGTLELRGLAAGDSPPTPDCRWDPRSACYRAPAAAYADLLRALGRQSIAVEDRARGYQPLPDGPRVHLPPRPYQAEALSAWRAQRGRGVVVLPTGAGKTAGRLPGDRRQAARDAGGDADSGSGTAVVRRIARDLRRPALGVGVVGVETSMCSR